MGASSARFYPSICTTHSYAERKKTAKILKAADIELCSGGLIGMGESGCTCGAVVGGIMALGRFFGKTEPKDNRVERMMALARELHDSFQGRHRYLCCRILTKGMVLGSPEHMSQCISFTGEVAQETAEIIIRELGRDRQRNLNRT
ncbi:MAG: C-GCAxxG-C-C family (seleno)protein [Syntrophales bacterium]|nr:C-GCAxxG-C-C family (seleno)protein [Syntrophales bacterium]